MQDKLLSAIATTAGLRGIKLKRRAFEGDEKKVDSSHRPTASPRTEDEVVSIVSLDENERVTSRTPPKPTANECLVANWLTTGKDGSPTHKKVKARKRARKKSSKVMMSVSTLDS